MNSGGIGSMLPKSVDEVWKMFYSKISRQEKIAFISAFICGGMAHGYMFANKLSFHDDMSAMFGLGRRIQSGRWFLEVLYVVGNWISVHVSSSWYNGIASLMFLAFSALMAVRILEIQGEIHSALCAGIIVVFPTVAATFAYMFTAPAYSMAIFFMYLAVYFAKKGTVITAVISGILISVSLGIYQAYIGIFASLAVILLIKRLLQEKEKFYNATRDMVAFLSSGVIGIVLYLLMNKIFSALLHKKSIYPKPKPEHLLVAVAEAYKNFLEFFNVRKTVFGIHPYRGIRAIALMLLIVTVLLFAHRVFLVGGGVKGKIAACIMFLMFPLAANFVYLITLNDVTMHTLMLYSLSSVFLLFCVIVEDTEKNNNICRVLSYIFSIGLFVAVCLYIKVDNVAYQYNSFVQEQTMTYYTDLIARIQSCSGYRAEMPVAFLNIQDVEDDSMALEDRFGVYMIALGYNMRQVVGDYAYKRYLALHCGYEPAWLEENELEMFEDNAVVKEMPCYPAEGSVRIVDDVVVVKFAEEQ
ncbi:MAG: hypothetical protein HDR16_05375 [Lachnospiraceae bacterium]|nr:hypothetical protein [Lachnospiraceae bacterium]